MLEVHVISSINYLHTTPMMILLLNNTPLSASYLARKHFHLTTKHNNQSLAYLQKTRNNRNYVQQQKSVGPRIPVEFCIFPIAAVVANQILLNVGLSWFVSQKGVVLGVLLYLA